MTTEDRLIKLADAVRAACPGEDVEIVDAEAVYVNFAVSTAVVISPSVEIGMIDLTVTAWDRSGGVSMEHWQGVVQDMYAPVIVRAFLDEQARHEAELDRALDAMNDEGGDIEFQQRSLVDVTKFTHIQRVDNDGNPIGEPIPLAHPRKDS